MLSSATSVLVMSLTQADARMLGASWPAMMEALAATRGSTACARGSCVMAMRNRDWGDVGRRHSMGRGSADGCSARRGASLMINGRRGCMWGSRLMRGSGSVLQST